MRVREEVQEMSWEVGSETMFRIIRKNEAVLRKISEEKVVWNLISKKISKDVSLAVTEATEGFYEKEVSQQNRIYYVLDGTLELKIEGNSERINKGDSCFILRDTEYEMSGIFKAIVVNQPAFGTEVIAAD